MLSFTLTSYTATAHRLNLAKKEKKKKSVPDYIYFEGKQEQSPIHLRTTNSTIEIQGLPSSFNLRSGVMYVVCHVCSTHENWKVKGKLCPSFFFASAGTMLLIIEEILLHK